MNRNMAARVLWQSVFSGIIAGIIYTVIFAITSKGFNGFIQGALVVAGITFVVAFLLNVIFSVAFMRKKT